jgi:hypothetical protein
MNRAAPAAMRTTGNNQRTGELDGDVIAASGRLEYMKILSYTAPLQRSRCP